MPELNKYEVIKRIGKDFIGKNTIVIGTFETFEEAHDFAIQEVCADIYHEPRYGADSYWFSDDGNKKAPYKVRIRKVKEGN